MASQPAESDLFSADNRRAHHQDCNTRVKSVGSDTAMQAGLTILLGASGSRCPLLLCVPFSSVKDRHVTEDRLAPLDSDTVPEFAPQARPCCRWRSIVQVPLLLVAAGGLGFAGQQIWQNPGDFQSYLSIPDRDAPCSSHGGCASAAVSTTSCATATEAAGGCCASLLALGGESDLDATAEEPASALHPENFQVVRSESF